MIKKYRVTLEEEERQQLRQLLAKGKADVRRLKHAQILLAADERDTQASTDGQIAQTLSVGSATPGGSSGSAVASWRRGWTRR